MGDTEGIKELFYTPQQAAIILSVSARRIKEWCEAEKIHGAVRIGRQWRLPRKSVMKIAETGMEL